MTPDELRKLAYEATENWRVESGRSQYLFVGTLHRFHTLMRTDADARLAALAPDLARLCADLGEALNEVLSTGDLPDDETDAMVVAVLARLAALFPEDSA